ncbi:MAG TPA: hypothetical protein VMV69_13970 [Pirellulales bacterium]|nr:hypothetical protein [Pirellulales bacterium]
MAPDRQKGTTFGVKNKKQAVKNDERRLIHARQIGFAQLVLLVVVEPLGQFFQDIEDPAPKFLFEFQLVGQRLLSKSVEEALAVWVADEGAGAKQRDKKPEIRKCAELYFVGEMEGKVGIGCRVEAIQPPLVAVGEDRPAKESLACWIGGPAQVVLDLLTGEPARRFSLGDLVQGMPGLLCLKNGLRCAKDLGRRL